MGGCWHGLYVSAEKPSQQQFSLLHKTISNQMMHDPCSQENPTVLVWWKIDEGRSFHFLSTTRPTQVPGGGMVALTNQYMVPKSPYLCQNYNCHINVEVCLTFAAVKYLHKYIYKGHDCADVWVRGQWDHNEIDHYLSTRFVLAMEAAWNIFAFPWQHMYHSVERLLVHEFGLQNVNANIKSCLKLLTKSCHAKWGTPLPIC